MLVYASVGKEEFSCSGLSLVSGGAIVSGEGVKNGRVEDAVSW